MGDGVLTTRTAAAAAGTGVALLAVSPPVDRLADRTLTAHMVQHVVLLVVAAPVAALGVRWPVRARAAGGVGPLAAIAWPVAWIVMWVWHVPALYDGALEVPPVHSFEHAALFATWTVAWATVVPRPGGGPLPTPVALGLVVLTALQSTLIGALLAFSDQQWYEHYEGLADGVLDQRIAGAVMSVAMTPVLLGAMAWLVATWLREADPPGVDRGPEALAVHRGSGTLAGEVTS